MFNLGAFEILLICLVGLLVLGPQKLPEAARTLGKLSAQFRHSLDDLKREITLPVEPISSKTHEPTTKENDQ